MKIKLIDCEEYERVEQFGTCDLCMHMGTAEYRTFTFENVSTGELFDVEAQEWCYGDFFRAEDIDNLARFAEWLLHNEVPAYSISMEFDWICGVIGAYNRQSDE